MWYFGLEEGLIKPNFSDTSFTAAVSHRQATVGSFWASDEFTRLDTCTGGALSAPAPPGCPVPFGTMSLGFDSGQFFLFKDHSTGVLCAR